MAMTIAEKILGRASGRKKVSPGEIVEAKVDYCMAHDLTAPLAIEVLKEMGVDEVWDPSKIVIVLDHQAPPTTIDMARDHAALRKFVEDNGIEHFYDHRGVCHQVMPEGGFALPGLLVVGADSHTCTYGALGCFATGVGSTDMAAVFATGKLWFKVPESMLFRLEGEFRRPVSAKDLILRIIGDVGVDGATYRSVEFSGDGLKNISVSGRLTMCNMGVEMGAKTAIVPPDKLTREYLSGRTSQKYNEVFSDPDAEYVETMEYDLSKIEPQVACPHRVDNVYTAREVQGVKVDQAFIGSCTNGRMEDLVEAARIVKGRKVARGVRFIVSPASAEVMQKALKEGIIQILAESGAIIVPPSCAACMGCHVGVIGPGEVSISSSNRNFKGRQGSPDAKVYLASPATVAASAVKGEIIDPRDL
ncbi:MAG: 3-isopropylmalate dehydratase large subunit [Candidatus Hadarchaeales archaeon]